MADLTIDGLAGIGVVVDAFGPFREALRVTSLAIGRPLEFGLVRRNLGYRVSPIVTVDVE
jgi:hypothetical protein